MKTIYLIDGSGYIFRAYHALPPLTRDDGVHVGAVYGFCSMMMKLFEKVNREQTLVIFDSAEKTFRQEIYPKYKANRPPPPEDLVPQFSIIRDSCRVMGVSQISKSGFEADDLIASYARCAEDNNLRVIIISSDKDLMQLVNSNVTMHDPIKNKFISTDEVVEKFGVTPNKVVDVQALAGDSTDNVPGVPGIGIKIASELIRSYGDLETLLQNAHTIKQQKRRESLQNNVELAKISKKLVTLKNDVDLPLSINNLSLEFNLEDQVEFFKKQGFKSLLSKKDNINLKKDSYQARYVCIQSDHQLDEVISKCMQARIIAVDTETTGLDPFQNYLIGVSLAFELNEIIESYYIPFKHNTKQYQLPEDEVLKKLKIILEHPGVLKIGHNIKFDDKFLNQHYININPFEDTMLLSYVLDAGKHNHNLDDLAKIHLNYETIKFKDIVGTGQQKKCFSEVDLPLATTYAAEDAYITLRLYQKFKKNLQLKKLNTLYQMVEKPLVSVTKNMEKMGILVCEETLKNLLSSLSIRIQELEREVYKQAGLEFNIGSPKQLGEVLFDKLLLPGSKKTKTGSYVTDVDVLEKLAFCGHDLPKQILKWRSLSKLKSTYVEGLLSSINQHTKRVHTSYNLAGTTTGRLSSSDPNLQNIPIRTEDGKEIRKAFIAEDGYTLVSFDYSQIELRFLAHIADIDPLQNAFLNHFDIHQSTASTIFNIPLNEVSADDRRKAKAVNFGIIYGISAFGLSQQLNISNSEAANIIKLYFERYPGIEKYSENTKNFARDNGYVLTLFKRRCHIANIHHKNSMLRQFAQRQAVNAPLQGSNADIIKKAMIKIDQSIISNDVRLLLQVHDELLFEIRSDLLETIIPKIKNIMESVVHLKVPLLVEVGQGYNWDEAH